MLGTELGRRITLHYARSYTENHLLNLQKVVQHTVIQAICRAAPPVNSSMALYNSICEGSFSVSYCPGSLRKVSCRTGGKYYCFNYQGLILTCIHYYLFTTPKMCCKGLHYVSYILMSTALLSFSYRVPY